MHGQNILNEIYEYSNVPTDATDLKNYLEFVTSKTIDMDTFVELMTQEYQMWMVDANCEEIRFYCKPTAYMLKRFLYAKRIKECKISI